MAQQKKQNIKPAAEVTGTTPETPSDQPAEKKPAKKAKPAAKPKPKPAPKPAPPRAPKPAPKPKRSQGVWGIDLGQCTLKAVRLEEIDGVIQATAFDFIEHPKILSQPDADRDALIREALEKFLANNNHLKGDQVAISVPGQSALTRFVKLPPVQQDKIADIVKFEAKQQIPFNLEEVIWDFQKVGEGTVTEGFAMDTEIGLFAMKRDAIQAYLQNFKDVGVEVDFVQIAPLALCNYLTYDAIGVTPGEPAPTSNSCVVALDMGSDSTNLVITNGGRIIWQKVISTGGNNFTRALTKDLKLTFAKAEHTKRNAAKSKDLKAILSALKPVLSDFEGEIKRSLNFFQNSHRSAQLEYILGMGNAFRLPGLQKFLEEKLGMPVKRLQKFSRLTGDTVLNAPVFQENLGTFTTAYGLALQGLQKARLHTNLLPPELRSERLIRAKKPWAVAASALLLVGLGATALRYGLDYSVYADPGIARAVSSANSTASQAQTVDTEFTTARSNAQAEEDGVKSVLAGQKEHTNWLELLHFVSEVVPRPDAKNLPAPIRLKYFDSPPPPPAPGQQPRTGAMSGKTAYQYWLKRQGTLQMAAIPEENPQGGTGPGFPGPGFPGPGPGSGPMPGPGNPGTTPTIQEEDLGPGIDDLIQFNIESIDCRYCSNLETYFKQVRSWQKDKGNYRPLSAYDAAPKNPFAGQPGEASEKGWVVELRGFTFHSGKRTFVAETLLENIARMGRPDLDKPGAQPAPGTQPMDPMQPMQPMDPMQPMQPGEAGATPTVPNKGPVKNRVSHVVLLQVESTPTADTASLKFAGQSVLDQLVRANPTGGLGGLGGGMPGPGSPMPGPGSPMPGPGSPMPGPMDASSGGTTEGGATSTGPSRDSWVPLTGGGAGGLNSGMGMGPGSGPGPGGYRPPIGPGGPMDMGPGGGGTAIPSSKHQRTEFIILFVWYEPTPSEATSGATDASGAGGAGMTGP